MAKTYAKQPNWLSDEQRTAWDRILLEMRKARVSVAGKLDVIERYVVTYCLWMECQRKIGSFGLVDGKRNPAFVDFHRLSQGVASIRGELGLGPASDSKRKSAGNGESSSEGSSEQKQRFRLIKNG